MYLLWDLIVRAVCEREREREDPSKLKIEEFSRIACDYASRETMHVPCTWLECEESGQNGDSCVSRVAPG